MRRVAFVVLLLMVATLLAAVPAGAGTSERSFVSLSDKTGEVRDGRGDLRWVSARFTERQLVFKAGLKEYQHWKSLNWRRGITTMLWELDLDGDNYSDYSAEIANSGRNTWVARLVDLTTYDIVCRGRAAQDGKVLTLRLPWPRCLKYMSSFRVGGTMVYDTKPYDDDNRLQFDLAPPRSFSRLVRRPQLTTWLRWKHANNRVRVPYGSTWTRFYGSLSSRIGGLSSAPLVLDWRNNANEAWMKKVTGSSSYYDGNVAWDWEEALTRSVQLRMRYGGNRDFKPSRSAVLHVDVTMLVTATMNRSGIAKGRSVTVRGSAQPAQVGSQVQLQQRTSSGWKTVSTATVLMGGGYSVSTTPSTTGDFVYRVRHGGDDLRVAGYSAPMNLRVYTAAITKVAPSTPQRELEDLNSEYVVVKNTGRVPVSISGWFAEANLVDWSRIPGSATSLAPGESVRVHSGSGTNRRGHVYLNRRVPMWQPAGIARLYDEHEDLVHEHRYGM